LDIKGIAQILQLITELLTAFIGSDTKYNRINADSKIIDIANWKTYDKISLDVE
jgi:hypothetical protein